MSSTKQKSDRSNLLAVLEVFFEEGLRDAEGIQKNETQRALDASLSYSRRNVDFGNKPSEAVSYDVARACVACSFQLRGI